MTIALTALVVWGLCGVIIAWLLSRHGHNFWLLALVGLGYGPLLVMIWRQGIEGQQSRSHLIRPGGGAAADGGWIDVLIGLDGNPKSVASAARVLKTLGPAPRRIRLTSVLDHEVANSPEAFEIDDKRTAYLQAAASELGVPHAELVLISGQPDKALRRHADENNFDLLIVAHRRGTLGSGFRGSTVGRLARSAEIPVLIGPPVD